MLAPRSIDDLVVALSEMTSRSRLVAGGTDLVPALHRGLGAQVDLLVDLGHVGAICAIDRTEEGRVSVGAGVTFGRIASNPSLADVAPLLVRAAVAVGSSQIRNAATLGGNVANASPCGDGTLALVALGADAVILDGHGQRRRSLVSDLVLAPGRTALAVGEAIIAFEFEADRPTHRVGFAKVGARNAVTVAVLSIAARVDVDPPTNRIRDAHVAFGSVGPTAFVDPGVRAGLVGARLDPSSAPIFARLCREVVDRSIRGRASHDYKVHAVLGVGVDVWGELLLRH
jgi:CO/xanthine dehydrogenase FAD-binding subunit